jgi:hypothetical protein
VGRRTLRGGAKGYCKNANRTSPGWFAERLGVQGRDREGGDAMGQRAGAQKRLRPPVSHDASLSGQL